jgi:hypothetical protein
MKLSVLALCVFGGVLAIALPAGAASTPSNGADSCGYSDSTFNENSVMRGAEIVGSGLSAKLAAFANDENALLIGVNGATAPSSASSNGTNSFHATNASGGDANAKDPSGRPLYPALFITNVSGNSASTAGDWQNGGQPRNVNSGGPFINDVFGQWRTGTVSGGTYTRGALGSKNNWSLGTGADAPTDTSFNEGYGAEVRWNLGELTDSTGAALQPGSTYRIQVIEHDGDQNKSGGDAGEYCVTLTVPGQPATPGISTSATSNTVGSPIHDTATLSGTGGGSGTITWKVYTEPTSCTGTPVDTVSVATNGDGNYVSPDYTPSSAGKYQWVATYTSGSANVSTACNDANEESTVTNESTPAIRLVKLERDGTSGPYLPGPINVKVGDTIDYLMTVSNTGNTPLVLNFSDPVCAGNLSAPSVVAGTYDASTKSLSVSGQIQYTCSHVVTSGDSSPFVNTATVTGTPPSGPPVSAQASVVANQQAVKARHVKKPKTCPAGTVKKIKHKHGKKVVVCKAKKLAHPPRKINPGFTG